MDKASCILKEYFENLKINGITDNKLFWKIVFHMSSEKHNSKNSKIILLKKSNSYK